MMRVLYSSLQDYGESAVSHYQTEGGIVAGTDGQRNPRMTGIDRTGGLIAEQALEHALHGIGGAFGRLFGGVRGLLQHRFRLLRRLERLRAGGNGADVIVRGSSIDEALGQQREAAGSHRRADLEPRFRGTHGVGDRCGLDSVPPRRTKSPRAAMLRPMPVRGLGLAPMSMRSVLRSTVPPPRMLSLSVRTPIPAGPLATPFLMPKFTTAHSMVV